MVSKMKIAFIVNEFPKISETFILNQITGLVDLGHTVEIFSRYKPSFSKTHSDVIRYRLIKKAYYFDLPRNRFFLLLKAITLLIANFFKAPIKILKSINFVKYGKDAFSSRLLHLVCLFLGKNFDIVHCHYGPNGKLGVMLKEIGLVKKVVTTFHGYDIRLGLKKGSKIYNVLTRNGDKFISISNYSRLNLINFGIPKEKIIDHSVGIDIAKFPFKWNGNVISKINSHFDIITIGRLVEEKGIEYSINAIYHLNKRNPLLSISYKIIGEGYLIRKLKNLIRNLNIQDKIEFLGALPHAEIIKEMRSADIFLLPSVAEVTPVVLMEAQAIGLPVIASNVGSVSQVVTDKASGFLVGAKDINAMVEKLEFLIAHPEIWPEMGRAGRKFVEENYDIKKLNGKLERIYKELVTNSAK